MLAVHGCDLQLGQLGQHGQTVESSLLDECCNYLLHAKNAVSNSSADDIFTIAMLQGDQVN